jgi:excisionase family DNA binding protein
VKTRKQSSNIYRSVEELAQDLGISLALAYRYLGDGTIPAIRLGRRYVIARSAVQRWLDGAGRHVDVSA